MIVVKFDGYDHKAVAGEGRETSVNRMYYQLLLHRLAQFYGGKRAIHVRLDAGNDSKEICKMRNQVCADAFKKYRTLPNCIRSIEPGEVPQLRNSAVSRCNSWGYCSEAE